MNMPQSPAPQGHEDTAFEPVSPEPMTATEPLLPARAPEAPVAPAATAPSASAPPRSLSVTGPALPEQSAPSGGSPSPSLPTVPEAPRTRWGGIIWGLVFLALAGLGFWSTTALSADFLADIWLRITPLAVGAGMVLIVGAIALLCALVALARHLQRRSAAKRSLV